MHYPSNLFKHSNFNTVHLIYTYNRIWLYNALYRFFTAVGFLTNQCRILDHLSPYFYVSYTINKYWIFNQFSLFRLIAFPLMLTLINAYHYIAFLPVSRFLNQSFSVNIGAERSEPTSISPRVISIYFLCAYNGSARFRSAVGGIGAHIYVGYM